MPGGLRLAYFIPIIDISGAIAGAMSVDVGWVDELVHRRKELRDDIVLWAGLILAVVALSGGLMVYRQMRPLSALARFAHDLAYARDVQDVPGLGRQDEIGFLADGLSRVAELRGNLERLAYGDPLTGLANRARYFAELAEMLAGAEAGSRKAALLMLDLDRFKETNDAFGQSAGDELLVRARDIILAELEEGDSLARLGGDDFVILSRNSRDEVQAQDLCRRLIERLAVPISMSQGEVHTGCSIGIAMLPRDGESAEEAHRNADLALRQAKQEGRSRFVFFDHELHAAAQKRMTLARMLRHALENDELSVHVQPQVRLKDGRLHGFEVLARWFHPTSGTIPPSEFIPVAEANGLIPALGNRVLDEACRIAREWADARFEFGHVSVNVSSIQLWQPNFVSIVTEALRRHKLPGYRLCLEVTESIFVNHGEAKVMKVFGKLRALGVALSLDDFGSGYSSLGYLNTLPLDQLKIDRAFVSGIDRDPRKKSLLAGIIALGKGLRLELVAEGAETTAEVEALRALGCTLVQGYYFAKPMPPLMAQAEAEHIRKRLRSPGKTRPERIRDAAA
jgi:diguanylate cyclase (GGDEF)-like protein